jgi:hypothetical protein
MDLMKLNIEADVILFHPYDKWGIDWGYMNQEDDLFYVKYLIARLSAYRNVWWSLGNEFYVSNNHEGKFAVKMDRKNWDLIGAFVKANDPHNHLISSHNIPFGIVWNCKVKEELTVKKGHHFPITEWTAIKSIKK